MGIPDPDLAAVKRELAALKANPAKMEQYIKAAMMHGYFVALEQARIEQLVGPALFGHEYRRYFGFVLDEIHEAQKETERIRAVLSRMQTTATNGTNRRVVARLDALPDNVQFQDGLRAFQGWVVSLVETYITLFGLLEGANGATRQVNALASALQKLINKRQAEGTMAAKAPELFKELTEL